MITIHRMEMYAALLNYTAGTSDPTEGGDPTGGDGNDGPNPFTNNPAKAWNTDE